MDTTLSQPFVSPNTSTDFAGRSRGSAPLRDQITAAYRRPEPEAVQSLLERARLSPAKRAEAQRLARKLAQGLRDRKEGNGRAGLVQNLLQEYALSSQEGVALMCLAEALLRIPDVATRNALIRDKISGGQWKAHVGNSSSFLVNAATWGLVITGKLTSSLRAETASSALTRVVAKGGEPLIRKAVDVGMRLLGEQFVASETISSAVDEAREREAQGFRFSYDMLGEAAMTSEDAARYLQSYEDAIHAIGKASNGRGVYRGPGISIKLSALHPRYSRAQYQRVMDELYPTVRALAALAKSYDIGLNIDAEEADRLELSLDLLERLCFEPELQGWKGIGFVIQAYQKRCPYVVEYLIDLARRSSRRLMVRLVKGAYWDSEIKRAQVDGQSGFPVYTRKVYTDVSYLACARRLLEASSEIYPQFATHNAQTMAAIYMMADPASFTPDQYEFQCLHGMGEPLYEQVVGSTEAGKLGRACRVYAPVGTHETLLAYLVRRLLENGANSSFVNRVADPSLAIDSLIEDPIALVESMAKADGSLGAPHPIISSPCMLYGEGRLNSSGEDLSDECALDTLRVELQASAQIDWVAEPTLGNSGNASDSAWRPILNPANLSDVVGRVRQAQAEDMEAALVHATQYAPSWAATKPDERAAKLERAADLLQERLPVLLGLLSREAGKTYANGIAEVREAIDFLRFYAAQAKGEFGTSTHVPLGPVLCISPWNFPLAIFVGQVAAALAAGNTVLAKPAAQTPLIAAEAVRLLHAGGIPVDALQLVPGKGSVVGAKLVADPRIQAVMFTGSTEVARGLQRTLAQRVGASGDPIPFIAETGGQNAMIVDSSALPEQVVADVLASAFDSAGQRCSALRVLCVQEEIADGLLRMLSGAVQELTVGNPALLKTDVGPVIDAPAREVIEKHIAAMKERGRSVARYGRHEDGVLGQGTYVLPTLIEIPTLGELTQEVFGPVLHVLRYRQADLEAVVRQIGDTGYGLTLGIHTRIDETVSRIVAAARVGNIYVNRNMVGAVVGVQPFGGEGLSGTGPKAGGPLYMYRLLESHPQDAFATAVVAGLHGSSDAFANARQDEAFEALMAWLIKQGNGALADRCRQIHDAVPASRTRILMGPTGEKNVYSLRARDAVLCLSASREGMLFQLAGVLAVGSRAVWPSADVTNALRNELPPAIQKYVEMAEDWSAGKTHFEVALMEGSKAELMSVSALLADRPGAIVSLRRCSVSEGLLPVEALMSEQSLSVNSAAAGGNATLMAVA